MNFRGTWQGNREQTTLEGREAINAPILDDSTNVPICYGNVVSSLQSLAIHSEH